MKIPHADADKLDLYREVRETCLATQQDRLAHYAENRRWFLYGTADGITPAADNKIFSHLDTVCSFLYAADSTRFSVKLGSRAFKTDRQKKGAFGKVVNEDWKNANADLIAQMAVLFALVYSTTFIKHIRRSNGDLEPFYVDPGCIGVYREDVPMLDRQEAFTHTYYMTRTELARRLRYHPNREAILKLVTDSYTKQETAAQPPSLIQRVTLAATPAETDTLLGQANLNIGTTPDYVGKIDAPLVEMSELWIWDDAEDDYRTVTMASDIAVVYDRQNIFMPRQKTPNGRMLEPEHGFVQVCPNPLPDYFWGIAEVDRLAPLQQKRNKMHDDIDRLLEKQVDPPGAWSGMGLQEEKLAAYNNAGSQISTGMEGGKPELFIPQIPADLYSRIHENDAQFDETSGLTNVLAGRGESGVRSSGHASKLASLGSSRPKKRALIIEDSLEKSATLFGKNAYLSDEDELEDEAGHKFVIAQMAPDFIVEVDAHSNSPVFMENQRETAAILFKARAIDRRRLIEMFAPPMQEDLIHDLETKIIPAEQQQQQAEQAREAAKQNGGKADLKTA